MTCVVLPGKACCVSANDSRVKLGNWLRESWLGGSENPTQYCYEVIGLHAENRNDSMRHFYVLCRAVEDEDAAKTVGLVEARFKGPALTGETSTLFT